MRRLAVSVLGLFCAIAAASFVFRLIAPDGPEMGDEVVQALRADQEQGIDVARLTPARADWWTAGDGPTRARADGRYEVGNASLAPVVRDYERQVAELIPDEPRLPPRSRAAEERCRYWPVVAEGGSLDDAEGVVRACYESDDPRSRPADLAYYGLDPD